MSNRLKLILVAVILCLLGINWICNKQSKIVVSEKPAIIISLDSNVIYDRIEARYNNQIIKLYDSIEYLNKHVNTAKTIYKTKIVEVWVDSVITTEECSEVINQANEIILSQDTLIAVQSRSIEMCGSQVVNLRNQVTLNKGYADLLLKQNIEILNKYDKVNAKNKRNRLFAGIVSAILVSFVLIK
jgi:hypothetical protein